MYLMLSVRSDLCLLRFENVNSGSDASREQTFSETAAKQQIATDATSDVIANESADTEYSSPN